MALSASLFAVGCGGDDPIEDDGDAGNTSGGGGRTSSGSSGTDDPWATSSSSGGSSSSGDGWGNGSSSGGSGWGSSSGGSSSGGSSSGGSSSGGSSSGGSSSGGSSSGSSGNTCNDPNDAPGTLEQAQSLPDTDDGAAPKTVNGILSSGDIDFYKVYVDDKAGAVLEPVADSTSTNLQLCMYAKCNNADKTIEVECDKGSYKSHSNKIAGCCSPSQVALKYSKCSTFGAGDDDIIAYISVESTANQCSPYTVTYGF